jgi:hypothetical protein
LLYGLHSTSESVEVSSNRLGGMLLPRRDSRLNGDGKRTDAVFKPFKGSFQSIKASVYSL